MMMITLHQRPRGYGGVAVAVNKNLSKHCVETKDGAVAILVISASPTNICIINAYLPCRGSHSEMEYDQALDTIQVLIEKYGHSHKILLAGDLNASLLEDRCSRDRRLVSWCNAVGLSLSKDYPLEATHIHHRGSGSSILDYLISTDPSIFDDITVMTECAENTSSHHPVSASLRISLPTGLPTRLG